jgi:ferrochelatase
MTTPGDFDALLFGGPEKPADVRPFLENVTRGRGVPPERLDAVVEHYMHFGGVSPINELNRDIIAALQAEFDSAGIELPIYFGNRNWHPMVEDTVATMKADGVRSALVFPTSAWGGYSGCRQYHEDIARARASVGDDAPHLLKIRQYYDHPLMVEAFAEAVDAARRSLPEEHRQPTPMQAHPRMVATCTAGRLRRRRVWWRPHPAAPNTIWCGSLVPDHRRFRGSTPTSAIISKRCPRSPSTR